MDFLKQMLTALEKMIKQIPRAIYQFIRLLLRRLQACFKRERKEDEVLPCLPIPAGVWLQPDAYIYSQRYLMSLGLAVTWDNPDVILRDMAGNVVGSHNLKPSTQYEVRAIIHNRSNNGPAPMMPVSFTLHHFGAGMPAVQHLGTVMINLPVRNAPGEPALAPLLWTTPSGAGHYCIEIEAVWPTDLNPVDNLGQHNTVIQPVHTGQRLTIPIPVMHNLQGRNRLVVTMNGYTLPVQPLQSNSLDNRLAKANNILKQKRDSNSDFIKQIKALNDAEKFPADISWQPVLSASELLLSAGEEGKVVFEAIVPSTAKAGEQQRFNVAVAEAESGKTVGGVTMIFNIT